MATKKSLLPIGRLVPHFRFCVNQADATLHTFGGGGTLWQIFATMAIEKPCF